MNEPYEPPLRGPWPAWTIAGLIIVSYAAQEHWLASVDIAADRFGFAPADLTGARWPTLFTAMFIHGGWIHAAMNAIGALAFGAPVARLLGTRGLGPLAFALFYLACGVLGNLGYALLNLHGMATVVGASGAVSGLFGAASRLIERPPGLSALTSRTVVGSASAWVLVNLVLGLTGYAPGLGAVQIAWQAHIVGYAAGLLLIEPWARLTGARDAVSPQP